MQTKILFVVLAFVVAVSAEDFPGLLRLWLGVSNAAESQSRYGYMDGFHQNMFRSHVSGLVGPGKVTGEHSFHVAGNVGCNPQAAYVDENQQKCYCRDNCIIYPVHRNTELNNNVASWSSQSEDNKSAPFKKNYNVCMHTNIGKICTFKHC